LDTVLTNQMESPVFPVNLNEVPANIQIEELKEMRFNIGEVRVEACIANHPGVCVGYRLFTPGGSVAFFPDNESCSGHLHSLAGPRGATDPAMAKHKEQNLVDFLRGAEMLIMDTQYDRAEYEQHLGWGHGCLDDVVALAIRAEVKRLFLFHHDPDHDDAAIDRMVIRARQLALDRNAPLQIEGAREGMIIELPARSE
jgi:phosphoribosyl 1,2-cyclic phosphodiesterase